MSAKLEVPGNIEGAGAQVLVRWCRKLDSPSARSSFDAAALRERSIFARQVIALQASGLRQSLPEVVESCRAVALGRAGASAVAAWDDLNPSDLMRLARLLALQDFFPEDKPEALHIYRSLIRQRGGSALPIKHLVLAVELAIDAGDFALASRLSDYLRPRQHETRHIACDLSNPFVFGRGRVGVWERLFNRFFPRGIESVRLGPAESHSGTHPFDRLTCSSEESIEGPLVTVMMSSWCPDESLVTSVASILKQTWKNIELLIVDDASPPEYRDVLQRVAAMDSRIRLLVQEVNGGTYSARNRGMQEAKGVFFTVQDSDDWAHPRRIERQVLPLLENRALLATHCLGLRVNDQLKFTMPGVAPTRVNESSLMFRLADAKSRIGFYDSSRKGADTEYSTRMRHTFGSAAIQVVEEVLTVIRLSAGSLSRAEFRPGWRHPARTAYRRAFEFWHAHASRRTGLFMPAGRHPGKFPRPARFACTKTEAPRYDFVFWGDFSPGASGLAELFDSISALARAGRRVGLIQAVSFDRPAASAVPPLWLPVAKAVSSAQIDEVSVEDPTMIEWLVIANPQSAQFANPGRTPLSVSRAIVLVSDDVALTLLDVAACNESVLARFGVTPKWVAGSVRMLHRISALLPPHQLVEKPWVYAIDVARWRAPIRRERRQPIVAMQFDEVTEDALACDVRDELAQLPLKLWPSRDAGVERIPRKWSFPPSSLGKPAFLAGVDIWLHLLPASRAGSLPLDVLQASAAGCVVIMDATWRPLANDRIKCIDTSDPAARTVLTDPVKLLTWAKGASVPLPGSSPTTYAQSIEGMVGMHTKSGLLHATPPILTVQ